MNMNGHRLVHVCGHLRPTSQVSFIALALFIDKESLIECEAQQFR